MKTTLLILSLLLTGSDLWAQAFPALPDSPAPNTNQDANLRRMMRRAPSRGTNAANGIVIPATVATPASNNAAETPHPVVTTMPALPDSPAPTAATTALPTTTT